MLTAIILCVGAAKAEAIAYVKMLVADTLGDVVRWLEQAGHKVALDPELCCRGE